MRSKSPKKQMFLFNLKVDPYESSNLAQINTLKMNELNLILDEHIKSMPDPKWPQSVFIPVQIDKTAIEEHEDEDELIYWPN